MVVNVTSLTRNGVRDWLIQRATAIVLALYTVFLVGYLMLHTPLQYSDWHTLFTNNAMRVFSALALISLVYHTWVGLWTVITDYIHAAYLRLTLITLVVLVLFGYLVWGLAIVWG